MKKRVLMTCVLTLSMMFGACGSNAATEVEQEDAAAVQEETPAVTEAAQEENPDVTETPEAAREEESTPDDEQTTPETEVTETPEAAQEETTQNLTPVNAQYQVYEGTYYDMNLYEATAEGNGEDSYCQIEVTNVTAQSFDFTVYQMTDGNKQMILDTRTAVFVEDGTKAVSDQDGTNLVFTFPDSWNALPKVVEMQISGLDVLNGNSYVNNTIPGYEFG